MHFVWTRRPAEGRWPLLRQIKDGPFSRYRSCPQVLAPRMGCRICLLKWTHLEMRIALQILREGLEWPYEDDV